MKEEIRRITKLVQEGKLSPEDAAELIDAMAGAEDAETEAPDSEGESEEAQSGDTFRGFVEAMEKLGKDVARAVNWSEVSQQIKSGTKKGVDSLREAIDQARHGKGPFVFFGTGEQATVELPLVLKGGKTLRIENGQGDVKIVGGAEEGKVVAHATIRGMNAEEAKRKAAEYTLVIEEGDGFVLLRQPEMTGLTVDLDIHAHGRAPIDVRCEAGDVEIVDTRSSCKVHTRSGDVRLTGLEGIVEVEVVSGDVTIAQVKGNTLAVESKSGDVSLTRVKAAINVRSASGDIRIDESAGRTVSVETASGDVGIDLTEPVEGAVNVRTVHGDARIAIPNGNCRVALSTLRGSAHCGFELADEARSEGRISGRIGEGLGSIDVSAINGDVVLSMRGADLGAD